MKFSRPAVEFRSNKVCKRGYRVHSWRKLCYNFKDLKVNQWIESCIRVNSIENSVQDHLPYISKTTSLYFTTLAYPKWPYVCLKINMYIICYMISFLSKSSTIFHHDMWSCDCVTMACDITLIPDPSSKSKK